MAVSQSISTLPDSADAEAQGSLGRKDMVKSYFKRFRGICFALFLNPSNNNRKLPLILTEKYLLSIFVS
jgi:hypothetical protein